MRTRFAFLLCAIFTFCGPAWAGPPFLTDDPEPVEYQHWEVYGFSAGTHVQGDTAGVLPGVEVNYGVVPDVQLHVIATYDYDKPSDGSMKNAIGDTEIGIKYRFIQEDKDGWQPQVGIFPLVEVPSGASDKAFGTGYSREFIPVWIQKSFGEWLTYGGGGYWINPGPSNKNYWFFGWLLQRQVTDALAIGGEIFHQTADTTGGPGGNGFNIDTKGSTGFNVGGTYDFTEHYHLLFSAGRGITNATTTNNFSYYLAFQWTI